MSWIRSCIAAKMTSVIRQPTAFISAAVKGQNTLQAGMPETFSVLMSELNGLCLDMKLIPDAAHKAKARN